MLKLFHKLRELDFEQLMAVYEEGNRENAVEFFPDDTPDVQLERAKQSFEEYLREDFFRVPGAFYAVWEQGGEYVSALRLEPYEDGWLLEALETKPLERRKGYAAQLIAAAIEKIPNGPVYSHVGKRNAASMAVHLKCGFIKILDHAKYVDGTITHYSVTLRKDI